MNPIMQREVPRENSTLNHVRCIFNDGEKLESSRNIWSSCMEYGEPTPNLFVTDGELARRLCYITYVAVGTQVLRD